MTNSPTTPKAPAQRRWRKFAQWPRRHPVWTTIAILAIALRVTLPVGLRSLIETQASEAIQGDVTLEGVDLWLLKGGLALDSVKVYPAGRPESPVVSLQRIYARISWLDLLQKAVVLRELRLDSPEVNLDVLLSGNVNLVEVFSVTPGAPETDEEVAETAASDEAEDSSAWRFALDRLVLESGDLRFRDFNVGGEDAIGLDVDRLDISRATLDPGTYEQPAELVLDATLAGAPVAIRVAFTPLSEGQRVHAELRSEGLPVFHAYPYIKGLAWQKLQGFLDLDVHYDLEPGRHEAGGRLALRDAAVEVADLDKPALRWDSLEVVVDNVDLLASHADVASVVLSGANVVVDTEAQTPPLLRESTAESGADPDPTAAAPQAGPQDRALATAPAATEPQNNAADPDAEATEPRKDEVATDPAAGEPGAEPKPDEVDTDLAATAPQAAPPDDEDSAAAESETDANEAAEWSWQIAKVELADVAIDLRTRETPIALGLTAKVEQITSNLEESMQLDLRVTEGESFLAVNGPLRIQPVGFEGRVEWKDLDLPTLLAAAPAGPAELIRKGRTSAALGLRFAAAGPQKSEGDTPSDTIAIEGSLEVRDLKISDDTGAPFSVSWKSLSIEADDVRVPLPPSTEAIQIELKSLALKGPVAHLTRTTTGISLPGNDAASQPAPPAPSGNRSPPKLRLGTLSISDGTFTMEDRSLPEHLTTRFADIDVDATRVRSPEVPHAERLDVTMVGPQGEPLMVKGVEKDGGFEVESNVGGLVLPGFDGYSRHYSGYGLRSGDLTVESTLFMTADTYKSDNKIVLHELDVRSGEGAHLFSDTFGVPISVALALLQDPNGNIVFDVPVAGDRSGTSFDAIKTIRKTLQRTVTNALTSPLKLLGVVDFSDDARQGIGIEPIPFPPGEVDPDPSSEANLERIAKLLTSRPALGIELTAAASLRDRDALAEDRLLRFRAAKRDLPFPDEMEKATRKAIQKHLDLLLREEPSKLSGGVRKEYIAMLRSVSVPDIRLEALASSRITRLSEIFAERFGLEDRRIEARPVEGEASDTAPVVKVTLGAAAPPEDIAAE